MNNIIEQLNPDSKQLTQLKNTPYKKAREIHSNLFSNFKEYHDAAEKLLSDNSILNIGVVGQVKAGKSSFLNSLFFDGENVLPQASTPMTAGLTVLKYCEDRNYFEVEYYNNEEWKNFVEDAKYYDSCIREYKQQEKDDATFSDEEIARIIGLDSKIVSAKELIDRCGDAAKRKIQSKSKIEEIEFDDFKNLQSTLQDYVGAEGTYTSVVKNLIVHLKDERLKGIQIVDTPGVNDPIVSRENKTRQYLQSSHGVFFLSYSGRFFDSTDTTFLTERIGSQGIGEIVVLASKYDSVLQDVGEKFKDDLIFADKDTQEKLKKQLNNNIQNSSYKGKDPKFDVTSGIGYSIFKKDKNNWTPTEKHVVEQMQRFYPSYFTEENDLKETFEGLSNIEPIREKYLEDLFKENKERIIENKIEDFFSKVKTNINKRIDENLLNLNDELSSLQEEDLSSLQERRKIQVSLLKDMEGDISTYINTIKKDMDKIIREITNSVSFPKYKLSTKKATVRIRKFKLPLWKEDFEFDIVDGMKLEEDLKGKTSDYTMHISELWKNKIDKIIEVFNNQVNDIIEQALLKNSNLDSRFYHRIIRETISAVSISSVLNLVPERNKFEEIFENITNTQSYYPSDELRVMSKKNNITAEAEQSIRNTKNQIDNTIRDMIDDIENKLKEEANEINDVLSGLEHTFIKNLNENITGEIERLERDLSEKEKSIEKIKDAMSLLENIKL